MASFHIPAWKYNYVRDVCSDGSLKKQKIQVPYASLEHAKPPIIARYLEGKDTAREVILIQDLTTIIDELGRPPSAAEAHGVIPKPDSQPDRPIWVFEAGGDISLEPPYWVDVVDLNDYSHSKVEAATICWVPHLQNSNGELITLLKGFPKPTKQKTLGARVIVQTIGDPNATKLAWRPITELRDICQELDSNAKRIHFEDQLAALQASLASPEAPAVAPLVRVEDLRTILEQNMESLRSSSMRCLLTPDASENAPSDEEDDDDDVLSDWTAVDRGMTPLSNASDDGTPEEDPYDTPWCGCTYPKLGPTWFNRGRPRHRHAGDEDCALGSDHHQHCIFADAYPDDCVIPEVEEKENEEILTHQHCLPPLPGTATSPHYLLGNHSDNEEQTWHGGYTPDISATPDDSHLRHDLFDQDLITTPESESNRISDLPALPSRTPQSESDWEMAPFPSSSRDHRFMDIDTPEMEYNPDIPHISPGFHSDGIPFSPPPLNEDDCWKW